MATPGGPAQAPLRQRRAGGPHRACGKDPGSHRSALPEGLTSHRRGRALSLNDSAYHPFSGGAARRRRALAQTDSPSRPIGSPRRPARDGGGGGSSPAGRHGPDSRDRVPAVPLPARRRRCRRPPRGAGLPHRRGRAGAARIESVLLAPAAHGPRVLVPDDGSPADILPGDLAAALLLPQSQSAGALGPPAARPPLRPPGTGHHHLQQAPERQAPLRHLARADRAAGRAVCQRAVRRRGAPALPQANEELDAGQAQAVPRNLGAGGLPAGLCQPDAGHVLPVVHHLGDQCLLVPRHAVSPSHQPGYHEPGEQRLPVPQAEPALSAQHGSELPLREPARPGLVPTAPHGGPLLTQGLFRT